MRAPVFAAAALVLVAGPALAQTTPSDPNMKTAPGAMQSPSATTVTPGTTVPPGGTTSTKPGTVPSGTATGGATGEGKLSTRPPAASNRPFRR